jgi:hypothetical protein
MTDREEIREKDPWAGRLRLGPPQRPGVCARMGYGDGVERISRHVRYNFQNEVR